MTRNEQNTLDAAKFAEDTLLTIFTARRIEDEETLDGLREEARMRYAEHPEQKLYTVVWHAANDALLAIAAD